MFDQKTIPLMEEIMESLKDMPKDDVETKPCKKTDDVTKKLDKTYNLYKPVGFGKYEMVNVKIASRRRGPEGTAEEFYAMHPDDEKAQMFHRLIALSNALPGYGVNDVYSEKELNDHLLI